MPEPAALKSDTVEWEALWYVASPHAFSTDLLDEVVILDLELSAYFGMDAVGAFVWERLRDGASGKVLKDSILAEFEVDAERCGEDLQALLSDLRTHGLIEVRDEILT